MKALLDANGEAVSGQQLADRLGVSRTAIWKHMQALQEQGFAFETVKKKGYVLKGTPNVLTEQEIQSHLETKRFGRTMHVYDVVDSTQVIAQELARNGAPDGTIVIAEQQDAGKGRMARPWESKKREGHLDDSYYSSRCTATHGCPIYTCYCSSGNECDEAYV